MLRQFCKLSLFIALSTLAGPVAAQVQGNFQNNQVQPIQLIGAPTVTITQVQYKAAGAGLIDWSVSKPTLTEIINFDVTFEVTFQNGLKRTGHKNDLPGSTRATTISIEPVASPVQSTKTTINTKFNTLTVLTASQSFNLAAPGATQPRPSGGLTVNSVRKLEQCTSGKDCFEVSWSANANVPSVVSFNSFNVKLEVAYQNGAPQAGSATANSSQRQVTIAVNKPAGATATTATATINASTTVSFQITTTK